MKAKVFIGLLFLTAVVLGIAFGVKVVTPERIKLLGNYAEQNRSVPFLPMQIIKEKEISNQEILDSSSITVRLHGGIKKKMNISKEKTFCELILINPHSRRIGYNPRTGTSYNEIPNSLYGDIGLDDVTTAEPGPITKELIIGQPEKGEYLLSVIGTGDGTYSLIIRGDDADGNSSGSSFDDIPISLGIVHTYSFYYDKTPGYKVEVQGGFDGGGQRPKDVKKFLSYTNPSQSQTTLYAGTSFFPLMIFYGKTIIANTFKAELNGVNISNMFKPGLGEHETVNIPLNKGRNVLLLSVDGNLPNRTATDTDRLVFIVP